MIKDALSRIEQKENIERVALKYHNPSDGVYVIVDENFDYKVISKDRFAFNSKYCCWDFYSQLVNTNKAVDRKKQILSNNYLSFFCKNIDKLIDDPKIIEEYYSDMDEDVKSEKYRDWIQQTLPTLKQYADKKIQLKIFFLTDVEEYISQCEKYLNKKLLSNIVNDGIGVSVFLNTNPKKTYMRNKTRKNEIPYFVDIKEAKEHYYLMRLLSSLAKNGNDLLYILEDRTLVPISAKKGEMLKFDFINGLILAYKFDTRGALIITDMDIIPSYSSNL
ncbi:MAG TPA: hypothetical protein VIK86_01620 [Candidatus Paceibacterota bacterium]